MLGKSFNFLMAHGADAEALARIKAEFEGASDTGTEILYRRKDGSEFWAALFISPVRDEGGDIIHILPRSLISPNIRTMKLDPGCSSTS